MLLNVVSGALYPHYPEAFDNPVFDLAFPLIGQGYAPYGLGWLLHLPGAWALAPLAIVVLAALALVAAGDDPRPRRMAAHLSLSDRDRGAVPVRAEHVWAQPKRRRGARGRTVVQQTGEPPRR